MKRLLLGAAAIAIAIALFWFARHQLHQTAHTTLPPPPKSAGAGGDGTRVRNAVPLRLPVATTRPDVAATAGPVGGRGASPKGARRQPDPAAPPHLPPEGAAGAGGER